MRLAALAFALLLAGCAPSHKLVNPMDPVIGKPSCMAGALLCSPGG